MANISKNLFIRLATYLSSSHQMFSHRATTVFFGFVDLQYIDVRYSVNIIIFGKFSQTTLMLHYNVQPLIEAFLIKKSFLLLLILKVRMSILKTLTIC